MQCTIKKEIEASGVGIHYNKFAHLKLKPAPEGTGVVFHRTDLSENNKIVASFKNIESTSLSTKIINEGGVSVSTIEHLMAALGVFRISNLVVEIDNIEVPIMDGGSEDFCFMIECVGVHLQHTKCNHFKLKKEIKVQIGDSYIIARPADAFSVDFVSDFPSAAIGRQSFTFDFKKSDFVKEVSSAKTIANILEVEMLHKNGMGLGGGLHNTLVYDKEKVLNEGSAYNINDFVKHKVLDFIGDISLSQGEIIANFQCFKSGHKLNHMFLHELFLDSTNYQLI